jgi:hypothetical protein
MLTLFQKHDHGYNEDSERPLSSGLLLQLRSIVYWENLKIITIRERLTLIINFNLI